MIEGHDRIDISRSGRSARPLQQGFADHYNRHQLPKAKRGQRTAGAAHALDPLHALDTNIRIPFFYFSI